MAKLVEGRSSNLISVSGELETEEEVVEDEFLQFLYPYSTEPFSEGESYVNEELVRISQIQRERKACQKSAHRFTENYRKFHKELNEKLVAIKKEEPAMPLPVMAEIHSYRAPPAKKSSVQIPPTQAKLYGYWVVHPEFNPIIPCVVQRHRKGDLVKRLGLRPYGYH